MIIFISTDDADSEESSSAQEDIQSDDVMESVMSKYNLNRTHVKSFLNVSVKKLQFE